MSSEIMDYLKDVQQKFQDVLNKTSFEKNKSTPISSGATVQTHLRFVFSF